LPKQSAEILVVRDTAASPVPLYDPAAKHGVGEESVATLEEEERRIDAEMAETRRMQELRNRKYDVQERLKAAKSKGPFEM
jgi:hypothetical protein